MWRGAWVRPYEANLCKDEFLSSDFLTLANLPLVTMLIGQP